MRTGAGAETAATQRDALRNAGQDSILDALDSALGTVLGRVLDTAPGAASPQNTPDTTPNTPPPTPPNNAERYDTAQLTRVVIAGNSVMAALLTGADTAGLVTAPYRAPMGSELILNTGPLREAYPDADICVLPPLAAFVGGDARAAALACGLNQTGADDEMTLLIDLGTNAEILLRVGDTLHVTSAAAGPAFSGRGKRLLPSEVLTATARALHEGALHPDGLLDTAHPAVWVADSGVAVWRMSERVQLSQLFFRELQLAIAAVRVAVDELLAAARCLSPSKLRSTPTQVYVAGAFGAGVAQHIFTQLGLLPRDWEGSVHTVGNAALAGAELVARGAVADIEGSLHYLDLAAEPDFGKKLLAATVLAPR
ncbi:MAG: ASKHA domain-containing protein [Actinomycetes bacterium]|nr:ASKHA domain-containing protein [Actinomycetes bacterium]